MKHVTYSIRIVCLSILLLIQITSCAGGGDDAASYTAGAPFKTSDLAGTWYIFATNGASNNDTTAETIAQGNLRGTLVIDSSGNVTGTSYTRQNYALYTINGGLITIDSAGCLGGSFTTGSGINSYLVSGKMDLSKNIISFVSHTNYGEYDLFTAFREGGSFASSDLADTWHILSSNGDYAGMTISDAGSSMGTITSSGGGGFLKIASAGTLSGDGYVTTNTGSVVYLTTTSTSTTTPNGKINLAKDTMSFASMTASGKYYLVTAVRAGGTFTLSDLAGTWYIFGARNSGTSQSTMNGTVIIDSSGNVTGGSYTLSDGGTVSFTGGTVTINDAGVLSGSAITSTGGTINLASGKMNSLKYIMSLVASTSNSELDFLFCIKGN